jgi:phosphate-selective porin
MIFRSYAAWFVSVAVTLLGVAASAAKATAQTTYPFDVVYNTNVPEPKINLVLIGVEVTAAGFLLRQRRLRSAA